MSDPIFKVTESFVEGERHVEVLRPLGEQDFDFEESPYESKDDGKPHFGASYPIRVGMSVRGAMRPEVLAQVKATFPADGCNPRFDRYYREGCELLANGSIRQSDQVEQDYRGCKDDKARRAKEERVLPAMREQAAAFPARLRQKVVGMANDLISRLVATTNESYAQSAIQNLTREWEGIHEQAGTAEDRTEGLRLIQEGRAKLSAVKARLNEWMLRDMEADGWKVNGKPLHGSVVGELAETYRKGEAFPGGRMLF